MTTEPILQRVPWLGCGDMTMWLCLMLTQSIGLSKSLFCPLIGSGFPGSQKEVFVTKDSLITSAENARDWTSGFFVSKTDVLPLIHGLFHATEKATSQIGKHIWKRSDFILSCLHNGILHCHLDNWLQSADSPPPKKNIFLGLNIPALNTCMHTFPS